MHPSPRWVTMKWLGPERAPWRDEMELRMNARLVALGLVLSVSCFAACDDETEDGGDGGAGGDDGLAGSGSGFGNRPGLGGDGDEGRDTFVDLPGNIRFANFVSDGTAGVDLDLYWGATLESAEFAGRVDYGEVTEYLAPRQSQRLLAEALLDEDEARYFLVPADDHISLPSKFLVNTDEHFDEATRETVVMSGGEALITDDLVVTSSVVLEHRMETAPLATAHVYVSSGAFDLIPDGDFVQVAAAGVCGPDTQPSLGNTGQAFELPGGSTDLFLTDANTDCATGSSVAEGSVDARSSYLLIGKADTYDLAAREAVLVELTPGL